jgi:hypothetical protein
MTEVQLEDNIPSFTGGIEISEHDFDAIAKELNDLFIKYDAQDVAIALNASDLWLPNISSILKHCLAFRIFASIPESNFDRLNRIESYEAFCDFTQSLHSALPNFPSLEDFCPEADWGEVSVLWDSRIFKIFYGGSVERPSDFIEAFRLKFESHARARMDMSCVLEIQHHIISSVDMARIGRGEEPPSLGHIETPPESFWKSCRNALLKLETSASRKKISPELIKPLGNIKNPESMSAFIDIFMSGNALPALVFKIRKKLIPISVRNLASHVIDHWAERKPNVTKQVRNALTQSISDFLKHRIDARYIVPGPLQVTTKKKLVPYTISALIHSGDKHFLIIVLNEAENEEFEKAINSIREIMTSSTEWGFILNRSHEMVQIRDSEGRAPPGEDIEIIAVLSRVTTSFTSVKLPDVEGQFLPLADFVTIFESIKEADELGKYFSYVEGHK